VTTTERHLTKGQRRFAELLRQLSRLGDYQDVPDDSYDRSG